MSVTSLNGETGALLLTSPDQSIGISLTAPDTINLIVNKTGSQGGVTSLNTLTGALSLTSSGHSIIITTPVPFASGGTAVNLETSSSGLVGINTINGETSDPASHNFSISGSGNIAIATGTYGLVVSDTSLPGIETINLVGPSAGDFQITGGVDIQINSIANGISIDYTGGAGGAGIEQINAISPAVGGLFAINGIGAVNITPTVGGGGIDISTSVSTGFEKTDESVITYIGQNTSNVTAPISVYVSGTEPDQICTVQIASSNNSTAAGGGSQFAVQLPLPTVGATTFLPKYDQNGIAIVYNTTTGNSSPALYLLDTSGFLYIYNDAFSSYVSAGNVFSLSGISLTFPIKSFSTNPFELGIAGENLKDTYLPYTEPVAGAAVTITLAASDTPVNTYNYGIYVHDNISSIVFSQQYTVEWNNLNSNITRYLTGTSTFVDTVNLASLAGLGVNQLEIIAMACPLGTDECLALTWDQVTNNVTIYSVYNIPSTNNLLIEPAIFKPHAIAMSCNSAFCAIAYAMGPSFTVNKTAIIDGITGVLNLVASHSEPIQTINYISPTPNNQYFAAALGDTFFTQRDVVTNGVITTYALPGAFSADCFLGVDAWSNILISAYDTNSPPPFPAVPFVIYAWSIVGNTEEYSITGTFSLHGRPVCISAMPLPS